MPILCHLHAPQYERNELQVEMLSETNRKQRRLERERRGLERPQPSTSSKLSYSFCDLSWISLQSGVFPTSHQNYPHRSHSRSHAPGHTLGTTGTYPSLTMLSGRFRYIRKSDPRPVRGCIDSFCILSLFEADFSPRSQQFPNRDQRL